MGKYLLDRDVLVKDKDTIVPRNLRVSEHKVERDPRIIRQSAPVPVVVAMRHNKCRIERRIPRGHPPVPRKVGVVLKVLLVNAGIGT